MKFLQTSIKFLLFATALTPLIVTWSTIFPYIFGKVVFFRSIIEITLILFLVYFLTLIFADSRRIPADKKISAVISDKSAAIRLLKNPLFIFTILFVLSLIISTIFAVNPYRAFWGTIDRGEGLFGMLHYFALLIMGLLIFEKKDWLNFFKIYLVSGLILIFYTFLQYFEIYHFPFALKFRDPRPGSFIGNPSFLAVHMIFLMMFAVVVFFESIYGSPTSLRKSDFLKLKFWRYFSLSIIILSALIIFLTGTRGAILGLGIGFIFLLFYFAFKKTRIDVDENQHESSQISINPRHADKNSHKSVKIRINPRFISVALLIFLIIFSGVFWTTRYHQIWQKIPGLDRLAKTAVLDVNDPSTQARLITWRLSWRAFKEKPLFGWGPENYLVAYEKYYDPDYAVYGETWMDRAHNKIFDVLVTQGIFGFLTYLGIFIAVFYLFFKKQPNYAAKPQITTELRGEAANYAKPIIAALLISYFVQNLLIFDQLNSDITFFVLLGYLISTELRPDEIGANYASQNFAKQNLGGLITKSVIVIVASGFLGYSVYAFNYVPFVQTRAFQRSLNFGNVDFVVERLKKGMYPYNFAQYNIRGSGIDAIYLDPFFYNPDYVGNPDFKVLGDLLIEGMDELARREPFDIRVLLREVEMLNGVTKVIDEKESAPLYKKAEALMREAVKRAPNRQEVYYHLAFNLAGQKRYDESIEAARYAVSLNSKVVRAHYHLALMLALASRNEEALQELAIVENLTPKLEGLMTGDMNTVLLIYNSQGRIDKVAEFIIKSLDGRMGQVFKRQYYEGVLGYFANLEDSEHFLQVANYLATFADLKDDMEVLIDLVKNGKWDIIHKL